jgi:hypothetical protein
MRPIRLFSGFAGIFAVAVFVAVQVAGARAAPTWLDYVNQVRANSGLSQLTENTSWSSGCVLHARYVVKTNVLTHAEDPANQWYTTEGNACGTSANVMSSSSSTATDNSAIDLWMQGPFHAVGVIDPRLQTTGFGSYRESDGGIQMSAALDVIRGRTGATPAGTYPVYFPGHGSVTHLYRYSGGESPNPLTSCPGYTAPTGLPLILQIGSGSITPSVTAHSFSQGANPLPHCVFDQTNYTNPDSSSQSLGRSVLNGRDAIVLIPQSPLSAGQTYTASITTNGQTYTWSFTISGAGVTTAPAPTGSSTPTATASATPAPTPTPSSAPSPVPSATPPQPSAAVTPSPTQAPSPVATASAAPTPTETPASSPALTTTPTATPTQQPATSPSGPASPTPVLSPPPAPTETPLTSVLPGDANCDGKLDKMDVMWLLFQLGEVGSAGACAGGGTGNMNCNQGLDANDLIRLLRMIAGLPSPGCT